MKDHDEHDGQESNLLIGAISDLTCAVKELPKAIQCLAETKCLATKEDLEEMEFRILEVLADEIAGRDQDLLDSIARQAQALANRTGALAAGPK